MKHTLPEIAPIPPYALHERLTHPRIAVAILIAVLLHAAVLLFFYMRPSASLSSRQQMIEISLETSASASQARPTPEKKTPPPPAPPETGDKPVDKPTQPVLETPPVSAAPTVATAQSSSPPAEKIQSLSSLTHIPSPLKKIEAAYPASERRAGIQAYVLAEVVIDSHGNVQDIRIIKSGGSAFDASVIEALKSSAFNPGYIGEKAVPVRLSIPFRFNLN